MFLVFNLVIGLPAYTFFVFPQDTSTHRVASNTSVSHSAYQPHICTGDAEHALFTLGSAKSRSASNNSITVSDPEQGVTGLLSGELALK
ncbi:hypothetical protein P879_06475 [Paragonimus westermani]|uniref:Uncharacterized protein n=1 Tax=Paragonimus westermani TaxID=34504 RepID=A0A8T0D1J4_9TREM|nr:hypothetical protein P879_06475 [Paragonimus westermani]